jgi:hypothetical protein
MQTQRSELLNQLPEHGWRVAGVEENLEWWAHEMWLLESVWSPVGSRAYVTFLVAPDAPILPYDKTRRKIEAVWAVMASPNKPRDRLLVEDQFTLSIGPGWEKELPAFFEHLSMIRNQNKDAGVI